MSILYNKLACCTDCHSLQKWLLTLTYTTTLELKILTQGSHRFIEGLVDRGRLYFHCVQGARAKMALVFGCIFCRINGHFMGTFWYLWKALCMHFQKLVLASPYYSIWRSYGWITEATSIFPVLFFCPYQDKLTKLGLCNCLSGLLQVDSEDYCSIVIKKQK